MFSSTKKVSEQQLLNEIKTLLGKSVLKHSKVAESSIGEGKDSVFMLYVWIYTYLATQSMVHHLGLSTSTIVLQGKLEDMLIDEASSSGQDSESTTKLKANHKKVYKAIADRFNKAVAKEEAYYDPLYMKVVSKIAVSVLAENYTDKSLEDYANEIGTTNFKKLLVIIAQSHEFNNDISKLLSKRTLATS
jgi:hypothetical protein